jgi:hypothetical protein
MSVRSASFSGMMNNNEADNFRRIQLMSEVDRAADMIDRYRQGIDHYREQIDRCHKRLGHIGERLGEPEEGGTR